MTVTFPLAPGFARPGFVSVGPAGTSFTYGSGPGQVSGTIVGTSYMSPDSTFSYINASLIPSDPTIPTQTAFLFGGQAVPANSQLLTQPPGTAKLYTFTLQQDAALQSPIPFVTQTTGGNIPGAYASPYYAVGPAQSPFGAYNAVSKPTETGTHTLQASLGISGQGSSQTSALVVQTGSFFTANGSNTVAGSGVIRGSYQQDATTPPVRIGSGAATVPDGSNPSNNIFGTGTGSLPIAGFTLDQNQYMNQTYVPNQVAVQVPFGGTTANYAFNQPATAVSSGFLFSNRDNHLQGMSPPNDPLQGYFAGTMSSRDTVTPPGPNPAPGPYAVTGTATVQTNATNNRAAATFAGGDPFGSTTLTVQFGSVTGQGTNKSRSTFVDNNRFAGLESPDTPSQVDHVDIQLNGDPTQAAKVGMVTSGTVPSNSLLPAGGLCSSCQFLQWGYWTGTLNTPEFSRHLGRPPGRGPHQHLGCGHPQRDIAGDRRGHLQRQCARRGIEQWRQLSSVRRLYQHL